MEGYERGLARGLEQLVIGGIGLMMSGIMGQKVRLRLNLSPGDDTGIVEVEGRVKGVHTSDAGVWFTVEHGDQRSVVQG